MANSFEQFLQSSAKRKKLKKESSSIIGLERIGKKRTSEDIEKIKKTKERVEEIPVIEKIEEETGINQELLEAAEKLYKFGAEYKESGKSFNSVKEQNLFREKGLFVRVFPLIKQITGETRKDITKEANRERNEELGKKKEKGEIKKIWKQNQEKDFIEENNEKEIERQERERKKALLRGYFDWENKSKEEKSRINEEIKKQGGIDDFFSRKTAEIAESSKGTITAEQAQILLLSGKYTLKELEEAGQSKRGFWFRIRNLSGREASLTKDAEEARKIIEKNNREIEEKMKEKWQKMLSLAIADREQRVENKVLERVERAGKEPKKMIEEGIKRKKEKEEKEKEEPKEIKA